LKAWYSASAKPPPGVAQGAASRPQSSVFIDRIAFSVSSQLATPASLQRPVETSADTAQSRIDTLKMREASGADVDTLMKIEKMEKDFSVEYKLYLFQL